MKKKLPLLLILLLSITLATAIATIDYAVNNQIDAELSVDFSSPEGPIKHGATGFLYGIAEENVPNSNLLYALSPQVLATRVPNGLQHPSGDIAHVESAFFDNGGANAIIYMQDIYPDWYYSYRPDYLETMSDVLDSLIVLKHADKFIYQPFNEMNNGVWYGDFSLIDNRYKFYEAFKNAYILIKEKTNGASVGGPAYTDYNHDLIKEFLIYCINNDCVPDVMIWHELVWYSTYGLRDTVADYRAIEKELGISERRVVIDEYGTFKDIGNPGNLIQYIASFEATKTEGCLAFWRLPNNMNDLASSQNMPTSAWWLYHWYSQMSGDTYKVTKSNKTIPYFSAVATIDDTNATIICGGAEGKAKINIEGIQNNELFRNASSIEYEIEYLDFEGLTTPSTGGINLQSGIVPIRNKKSNIIIDDISYSRAYRIKLYPSNSTSINSVRKYDTPARYEAEDFLTNGTILRYDDIRYASSGGGIKLTNNTSAKLSFNIKKTGLYAVEIVYASNPMIGDIRLNPRITLKIDGMLETIYLPNTLTDISSNQYKFYKYFESGAHTLEILEDYGDITLDFIDIAYKAIDYIHLKETYEGINLHKNQNEFMVVTEKSGYYRLNSAENIISINNTYVEPTHNSYYLQKGINLIKTNNSVKELLAESTPSDLNLYSVQYANNAEGYLVKNDLSPTGYYLLDTPEKHMITFNINVQNTGYYALTTLYSNSEVNGSHAYNVKLVERYATIEVNNEKVGTHYLAHTYANSNFEEHTTFVWLQSGNNNISFVNNGETKWNNLPTKLPNIAGIQVIPVSK